MRDDKALREQLSWALKGEGAHASFDDAVAGIEPAARGKRPAGAAHSPWELIEHLRIAQADIFDFTRNVPGYQEREFPKGYWPASPEPPDAKAWDASIAAFHADLAAFVKYVEDDANDLVAPLPQSKSGATIMAQALMTADHNSYHVGQLVIVRRLLGDWK